MSKLGDIKYEIELDITYLINKIMLPFIWKPKQMGLEETLDYIIENKVSISRFGDGEYKWMFNEKQTSFQNQNEDMRKELISTYHNENSDLLLCISDCFSDLSKYKVSVRKFWSMYMMTHRNKIRQISNKNYKYGNLSVTRFYIDYLNTDHVPSLMKKWKSIWKDKNIVIVEGELTRLGVGNDLFDSSKTIKRIIAPAKNAYDKSEEILDYIVKNIDKNDLILLALGPTATILAAKLSHFGYQALDVGHIDVEYEWYLQGAKSKTPIKYKYVNEASRIGGVDVDDIENPDMREKYNKEIVVRIL